MTDKLFEKYPPQCHSCKHWLGDCDYPCDLEFHWDVAPLDCYFESQDGDLFKIIEQMKSMGLEPTGSRAYSVNPKADSDYDFWGKLDYEITEKLFDQGFEIKMDGDPNTPWVCWWLVHRNLPLEVMLFDDEGEYQSFKRAHEVARQTRLRDLIPNKADFWRVFWAIAGKDISSYRVKSVPTINGRTYYPDAIQEQLKGLDLGDSFSV